MEGGLATCYLVLDAACTHLSRSMAGIFKELPDRKLFPDYYQAIPEPECLDNLAVRRDDAQADVTY